MKNNDFLRKNKPKSNIMFNNPPPSPYEINTFFHNNNEKIMTFSGKLCCYFKKTSL